MVDALFFVYKRVLSSLLWETHKPTYTYTKNTEFFLGTEMGSSLWCFFSVRYITLLLLINAACCFSFVQTQTLCHDDERSALLQFKASFTVNKSASQDPFAYPKVAYWGRLEGDPQRSNCCSWDGVECNHDSGHVIGLDLASSYLHGSINSNSSLFQLVQLQRLDLSDNNFSYSQIPSSYESHLKMSNFGSLVQNLTNIKQLHLSWGQFPVGIFHLPNLQVLDLANNEYLNGYFPDELNKSSPLKILDLFDTDFSGHLPASIGDLRALNLLNIGLCTFYPHVPSSLSNLTHLNFLDLSYFSNKGNFSGQVTDSWSWVGKLTKLNYLSLVDTNLRGDFPCFLANLTQLVELDLSENQIGEIPSSLANLTQLSILHLRQNQITGEVSCFLANLKQLSELRLYQNQITGQIPSCLGQLTHLTSLDVQFNNLQGTIPRSLFDLRNLEYIYLDSNNLSGYVEFDEFSKLEKLRGLSLSHNKLSVQMKKGFSAIPPKLQVLGLGSCNLTEFPEFLKYSTSKLVDLDLADKNLQGQIPKWICNSARETLRFSQPLPQPLHWISRKSSHHSMASVKVFRARL
ncbi:receptor-like protein 53 [Rosa rugosa]|uniref:receptor-like protein 53 n=1 Tax=Rosa rugosa TaxID=74645 RepID=UPI002B405093|nr:receptor-like protein 53 [Rosa rugosa]